MYGLWYHQKNIYRKFTVQHFPELKLKPPVLRHNLMTVCAFISIIKNHAAIMHIHTINFCLIISQNIENKINLSKRSTNSSYNSPHIEICTLINPRLFLLFQSDSQDEGERDEAWETDRTTRKYVFN